MTVPNLDTSKPDTVAGIVQAQRKAVHLCRTLFAGGEAIRSQAHELIPQYPGELKDNYAARKARLFPFLAFERTVTGLLGMIFRRDVVLGDDVPELIAGDRDKANAGGHWENLDLAGTHGDVFVRERGQDAMVDGHAGIFVDFPTVEGTPSLADERVMGARAYWVPILKSQIINVRTDVVNGRVVLALLVLEFCRMEPDGEFGEQEVYEYRVYRRSPRGVVTFQLYRKTNQDREPVAAGVAGVIRNQDEIPFAVIYGPRKVAPFVSKPPLSDLAERQVAHMQLESDEITALHMTVPTPVISGMTATGDESESQKTGPSWCHHLTAESKMYYLEHSGAGLASFDKKLENLKGELATLGLAMLQRETRAAETAEGKRMDKSASDSALAVFARNIQDAVEQALYFHAKYQGEKDGGSVTINKDFESLTLGADVVQAYSQMVASGQMSLETMWAKLEEGEWLPDDFDAEEEKERIMASGLPGPVNGAPEPEPVVGEEPKAGDENKQPQDKAA